MESIDLSGIKILAFHAKLGLPEIAKYVSDVWRYNANDIRGNCVYSLCCFIAKIEEHCQVNSYHAAVVYSEFPGVVTRKQFP